MPFWIGVLRFQKCVGDLDISRSSHLGHVICSTSQALEASHRATTDYESSFMSFRSPFFPSSQPRIFRTSHNDNGPNSTTLKHL